MKPAPFTYHRPESFDHAVALLVELGDEARPLAGGQSLTPLMNFRLARPTALVDLASIPGCRHVILSGDELEVGALATHAQLEFHPALTGAVSVVADTARSIGHPAIRNMGTIGGSLAHADPAAEWCTLLSAMNAEVLVIGPEGSRTELLTDFIQGPFTTSLSHGELIEAIRLNHVPEHAGFAEFARRHGDFAIAMAAVTFDTAGTSIANPRVIIGGVGPGPSRIGEAEDIIDGEMPSNELFEAAAASAAEAAALQTEGADSNGYLPHLVRTLVKRACTESVGIGTKEGAH